MSSSAQLGTVNTAGITTLAFTGTEEIVVVILAAFLIGVGFFALLLSRQVQPLPMRNGA